MKKVEVEILEEKKCKKCGEPLPSTSKYKKCDNCRRKSAELKRNLFGCVAAVAGSLALVVPVVNKFVKKK